MSKNDKSYGADISEILKKISDESSAANLPKAGDIEFEIGDEPTAEVKAPLPHESEASEVEAAYVEDTPQIDIFELAEREDGEIISDDIFKIQTVYIPRFTDASDDYHRLGFIPEKKEEKGSIASFKTDKTESALVDAVAEIDGGLSLDAKIVEVVKKEELIDSSSTVFKFDTESPACENSSQNLQTEEAFADVHEECIETEEKISAHEPASDTDAVECRASEDEEELPGDEEVHVIEEPLKPKVPEVYVPVNVAKRENILHVGDELSEEGRGEFSRQSQRDGFKDKFLDLLMSQRVRFLVALAISIFAFIFESIGIFGVDLIDALKFDAYPAGLALIDLQCVICLVLLASPEIIRAMKGLFKKNFSSDLFVVPAFLVYLIYCIAVFSVKPFEYPLFGAVVAFYVLSSIAAAYLRTKADFTAFKKISEPTDKYIADIKYTRTLEDENMALDGLVEEYKSKNARVFRTSFVADFFTRTKKSSENPMRLLFISLTSLGVAILSALIGFLIYKKDSVYFAAAFASVFLFSVPALSLFLHKLPHLHSAISAASDGGALIGEAALFECSGTDVIAFEDTEIFGADDVNIQRIMLYGNRENLTKALRQMSALFMNVGGPLDTIFSDSLDKKCSPANGVSIYDEGIVGEIDGKKIMAGSYSFMISEGALVPPDDDDAKKSFDATKIMYAAENGVVYAKFYIRYRFSEEFTQLMPILKDEGIIPIVYTRDPNIKNELLKTLTAGVGVIRILKKYTLPRNDFAPSKVSASLVFEGDKSNLLNLLLVSKHYVKFNQQMRLAERSATISGLLLGALISLAGMTMRMPPVIPVLWHSAWCVMLYIFSRRFFKLPKKEKKKEKKKNAK